MDNNVIVKLRNHENKINELYGLIKQLNLKIDCLSAMLEDRLNVVYTLLPVVNGTTNTNGYWIDPTTGLPDETVFESMQQVSGVRVDDIVEVRAILGMNDTNGYSYNEETGVVSPKSVYETLTVEYTDPNTGETENGYVDINNLTQNLATTFNTQESNNLTDNAGGDITPGTLQQMTINTD